MREEEKLIEELIQLKLREQEIYKFLSLDGAMDAFFALTERGIDPLPTIRMVGA